MVRVIYNVEAMSTFKKSFAYAEALFRIMDAVEEGSAPIEMCQKFDWEFPGGKFGVRSPEEEQCPHDELTSSETEIPGGHMSSWVDDMEARKSDGYSGHALYPEPIRKLLFARRRLHPQTFTARASWAGVARYLVERSSNVFFGMTAVYELSYRILLMADHQENKRVSITDDLRSISREFYLGGSAGADLSMTDLSIVHEIFHEIICKLGVPYMTKSIASLERMISQMGRCRKLEDELEAYDALADDDGFGDDEFDWEFRSSQRIGDRTVEIRPKCAVWRLGANSWCLSLPDARKCLAYIIGVRNYLVGLAADAATSYSSRGNTLLVAASKVKYHTKGIADIGRNTKNGNHLDLCKAYKSSLAIVKATIAGPMSATYIPDLREDLEAMPIYGRISSRVEEFISDCTCLPPTGALPLAKVFRLMPPPDVWIHDALRDRWLESSIIRNVGHARCEEFRNSLREVIMTAQMRDKSRKLPLRNKNIRPSWWDEYSSRDYDNVPTASLYRDCESRGTVEMVERSRYNPTVWKDSGCGADTLEEGISEVRNPRKRNFLMRMIYDASCPMPEDDFHETKGVSQAGLKGESHKKRIFYSNHVASRMHQSRCDATVGEVMRHHPSFAIQKTGVERDDIFNELSSPPSDAEFAARTGIARPVCTLFYSFDIKGWSASMPGDIQKTSHEVWDEFTDTDNFSRTSANHEGAVVYCAQDGLTSWYTNGTANFEGYNGKEMTALHIAIMTIAVRRLRGRLPNVDPRVLSITLQAYIDDGLARLVLPKDIAMMVFNEWCEVVVETWRDFGFTIERKKSFPSPAYFEFLGEEYFAGAHLATGSKAAMRITAEPFEVYESLRDRVTKLCTACRGACVAGLPPPSGYLLQSYMISLEMRRWVKIRNSTAVAAWSLTPVSLGGLGVPSLFQQATNAAGATTEECMTNLWYWARSNPAVREAYIALLRRGMMPRTARDVLNVPLGGQSSQTVMAQNPIGRDVIARLQRDYADGKLSPLGSLMMDLGDDTTSTEFSEDIIRLASGEIYQEALLNDIAEPLPGRIFRAFISRFESARTIRYFVPRRRMTNVIRRNKIESKRMFTQFLNLVRASRETGEPTRVGTVLRRGFDTSILD